MRVHVNACGRFFEWLPTRSRLASFLCDQNSRLVASSNGSRLVLDLPRLKKMPLGRLSAHSSASAVFTELDDVLPLTNRAVLTPSVSCVDQRARVESGRTFGSRFSRKRFERAFLGLTTRCMAARAGCSSAEIWSARGRRGQAAQVLQDLPGPTRRRTKARKTLPQSKSIATRSRRRRCKLSLLVAASLWSSRDTTAQPRDRSRPDGDSTPARASRQIEALAVDARLLVDSCDRVRGSAPTARLLAGLYDTRGLSAAPTPLLRADTAPDPP